CPYEGCPRLVGGAQADQRRPPADNRVIPVIQHRSSGVGRHTACDPNPTQTFGRSGRARRTGVATRLSQNSAPATITCAARLVWKPCDQQPPADASATPRRGVL